MVVLFENGPESGVTESVESPRQRLRARYRVWAYPRRTPLTLLVIASLLFVTGGWVGVRAWQVRGYLLDAAALAQQLRTQMLASDKAQARRTLSDLQEQTKLARAATRGPSWRLGGAFPYAGDDLAAVRRIAVALDELARHALPELLRAEPVAMLPKQGRFDLRKLSELAAPLARADQVVRTVQDDVAKVPTRALRPQLREAVTDLRAEVRLLARLTANAQRASALLPRLLGADGARTYLVVSQNPAELRSTGGIFGAYALARAEKGRLRIVEQGSGAQVGPFREPVLRMDSQFQDLYDDLPGVYPADVNLTPHFPTAAKLYREMFRRRTGIAVDGVLAMDPVVLSYLLKATGPVTVPPGVKLTSESAVRVLLSDSYQRLSPHRQDTFFAASARAAFDTFLTRPIDQRALITAIDRAVAERRLLFWSAWPAEQRALTGTAVEGALPERESIPTVGVFLNDGSGAKLGYYLVPSGDLTVGECRDDGRRELRLRVTLRSMAPRSGLSRSVLGLGLAEDPYTVRTVIYVFSPAGGTVASGRLDGQDIDVGSGSERGRQVGIVTVDVSPGGSRTIEISLLTAPNATGDAGLWLTPAVHPWTTHITTASTCDQ